MAAEEGEWNVLITALVLATLVALFAVQNAANVTVRIAVWSFETSLVMVVLVSVTLGAATALLWSLVKGWTHRHLLHEERERVRALEAELRICRDRLRQPETGHA
ncbi:MAG TPA: DUF1049 domain-containing protein [Clostridiales bacterium UBA8153]|nr:DUF1049 domain-containing protein [Clostridiales bacterium UBA8153]